MKLRMRGTFSAAFVAALTMGVAATASANPGVDPVLLNLVMPDSTILTGIQVDAAIASGFGQYILTQMQPGDPGFQKFIQSTGFDPTRDLQQILGSTNAGSAAAGTSGTAAAPTGLMLARGTFVPTQILGAATAAGATIVNYKGFSIISPPPNTTDASAKATGIVFFDATTAAAGPIPVVEAAIDRYIAKASYSSPLATQAQTVGAVNQAWFATVTPLSDFLSGKLGGTNLNGVGNNNALLQAVTQASGGVNFGSASLTVTADAVTTSAQNAQSLVDVMKFLVSMIGGSNPDLASIASSAQFSVVNATAHLSLTLNEQQIEQLMMPAKSTAGKVRAARVHQR